jgi:hypothetical protein
MWKSQIRHLSDAFQSQIDLRAETSSTFRIRFWIRHSEEPRNLKELETKIVYELRKK